MTDPLQHDRVDEQLPFDPLTLVRALRRRWRLALGAVGVAMVVGIIAGLGAGERVYSAETVLLYRPRADVWAGDSSARLDSLSLRTQGNLVKVRSNLESVRERLTLPVSIERLGAAVSVVVERGDDNLLIIGAEWSEADATAAIANTMRDVFLQGQVRLKYQEEATLVQRLFRTAEASRDRIQTQVSNLGRIADDLKQRVTKELERSPDIAGLGDVSTRIEHLRKAIHDSQDRRANLALLTQKEVELERARSLIEIGGITQGELEEITAEYERLKALTIDTPEVAEWRAELERLQATVLPGDLSQAPTAPLLQSVMLRAIDLEFELAASQERVAQFAELRSEARARLEAVEEGSASAAAEDAAWRADADFRIVSAARTPTLPMRSNRRVMAAGVGAAILLLAFGFIAAREVLATKPRSGPELQLRLDAPVLGVLPEGVRTTTSPVNEHERLAGQRIVRAAGRHKRVLVSGATHGIGTTSVVARVAAALADQGHTVLVADVASHRTEARRPTDARTSLHALLSVNGAAPRPELAPAEIVPSGVDGVDVLRLDEVRDEVSRPHWSQVADVVGRVADRYDLVLLDGPPVLPYADALAAAAAVDGVVLVARAEQTSRRALRTAKARLDASGTPLVGGLLNRVGAGFLDLE
jgi:Mrp family chromosome partitioning ATPase